MKLRLLLSAASVLALSAWLGVRDVQGDSVRLRPSVRGASSLVYPAPARTLRIDHASRGHRELACAQCHAGKASGARPLAVSERACTPCHAELIDREQASADRCGRCHVGYDPARASAPAAPPPVTRPRLIFDHARHPGACLQCHAPPQPAAAGDAPEPPALPRMESCLGCHAGERALACGGCHVAQPSGRLRTHFPEGKLVPRSDFLGMAHDADFSVRHRWVAADHGATCASCHGEDECAECHDGRRRPAGIHPNDYLALHPQEAQRAATRCTSCHATQTFCGACHARLGISQRAAPDLASPRRFHPAAAVWSRGPVLHAREAQRALDGCISCHAEQDCVECHGSRSAGFGGASPHPAGFVHRCARALARDSRPCFTCHAGGASLERCR